MAARKPDLSALTPAEKRELLKLVLKDRLGKLAGGGRTARPPAGSPPPRALKPAAAAIADDGRDADLTLSFPGGGDRATSSRPRTILLTGATGVLGRMLIKEGLAGGDVRFISVVRAQGGEGPGARLRAVLDDVGLADALGRDVYALPGELGRERFGVSDDVDALLRAEVDEFFHLAALTNLTGARDELFRVNVEGTVQALALARELHRHGRLKRFFYFSTAFVAGSRQNWCAPEDGLCPHPAWANPYEESKYVAESKVRAAMADGLPVTIFRPSIVVGDQETGKTSDFNVIYPFLRLAALGHVPVVPARPDDTFQVVPVDFVARAAWAISRKPESLGRTYHLASKTPPSVETMLALKSELRPETPPTRLISPDAFDPDRQPGFIRKAIEGIAPHLGYLNFDLRFDTTNTERELQGTGIEMPETGYAFMRKIAQYAIDAGYLV